jgi:phosphomannomutase
VAVAGLKIIKSTTLDGVKLILSDGSWVLCRPSGTEPLIRIYVESDKPQKLEAIVEAVRNLL